MRYRAYYLSTTDNTITSAPRPINVNVKRKFINLEFMKKIPMVQIVDVAMEYKSEEKSFSVAKAGAGLLIAGPLGLVGGALGGKKVTYISVIKYLNENHETVEVRLEGKTTVMIKKKFDKIQSNNSK